MLLDIIQSENMENVSHCHINITSVDSKLVFLTKCLKKPSFYLNKYCNQMIIMYMQIIIDKLIFTF